MAAKAPGVASVAWPLLLGTLIPEMRKGPYRGLWKRFCVFLVMEPLLNKGAKSLKIQFRELQ